MQIKNYIILFFTLMLLCPTMGKAGIKTVVINADGTEQGTDANVALSTADKLVTSTFTLNDGEPYNLATESTVTTLTYNRTFQKAGVWAPLYVPFSMTVADLKTAELEAARITNFHQTDLDQDGTIDEYYLEVTKMVDDEAVLQANTPYLIRKKAGAENLSASLTIQNATLMPSKAVKAELSSASTDYTIVGNYTQQTGLKTAGRYILTTDGELAPCANDDVALAAQRWSVLIEENDDFGFDVVSPSKVHRRAAVAEVNYTPNVCGATIGLTTEGEYGFEWQEGDNGYRLVSNNYNKDDKTAETVLTFTPAEGIAYPATLSFNWMVSSEEGYDKFTCKVESSASGETETVADDESGQNDGTYTHTFTSSAEVLTITLTYSKDGSDYANDDCAAIYNISFDGHQLGDYVCTKEPTCVTTGINTATCIHCGSTVEKEVPATGIHTWQHYKGNDYYCQLCAARARVLADANADGDITILDAAKIIESMVTNPASICTMDILEHAIDYILGITDEVQYNKVKSDPVKQDNRIYIVEQASTQPQ